MIQVRIRYTNILLLLLFSMSLTAQQAERNELEDFYQDQLHPSDAILNGREYKYYFHPLHSTPLIPENPFPSASVLIRDQLYQNVILQYDTYKDMLVYYNLNNRHNNMITPVIVNRHIVEEFALQLPSGQAIFRYLFFPEDQKELLSSGFYEIVSEGECKYIIHHGSVKKVHEQGGVYLYKTEQYIINSGAVYRISGKKALLKALSDRAEEVKLYLKRSKIWVKRANKEQIKGVIDYYMSLKQL